MILFITGGVRSGKSRFAQDMALRLCPNPVYLATAKIWDDDFRERVNRHQAERGPEWTNYEAYQNLHLLPLQNRTVVIDCVTLWLTNFFVDAENDLEKSLAAFKKEIEYLTQQPGTFIIISNELGMGLHADTEVGRKFTDLQGWANQYVAAQAEEAIFMVSGQPLYLKKRSAGPLVTKIDNWPQSGPATSNIPQFKSTQQEALAQELQHLIDQKTKPQGALGELEKLALQIGRVFNTTSPQIQKPHVVVFAADHGIAQHGVSAYPPEVTSQMVKNFVAGGAAINVFCKQHGLALTIVDAGVNYDFAPNLPIINQKMGRGTQSFLNGPAMTVDQVHTCLQKGAAVVKDIFQQGCNTIGFGEMGIGNTSSASVLMSLLGPVPLEQCIGKGTGVTEEKLLRKREILQQAILNYSGETDKYAIMAHFGGFEILQMAGGMLEAYKNNMLILVDGFIATVAFLCACRIDPVVKQNAIFCHQSGEAGHQLLLSLLQAKPLLQLGMRLGEGTGCAVAYPLLQSAVAFLNEMASFEAAGVSNKA